MSRLLPLLFILTALISLTNSQSDVLRVRRSKSSSLPVRRATRGVENPFEMPDGTEDEPEQGQPAQVCPVSLSDSFDLIRAINNFRITHSLSAINISRSLMSTACAHMRDIAASESSINNDCGLHSWSSCCYPSDHSNPNCMHRKALQVTTSLKWNIYNVAAYELAYEWAGGPFSAIRALDMFVANPDHKKFLLQEDTWSEFKWRAIGASVGDRYAYIWFGTLLDPNGDFDQFNVENHVMEMPGCACTGTPITWMPTPTLSPEQQIELDRKKRLSAVPSLYVTEEGHDEVQLGQLLNSTTASLEGNTTVSSEHSSPETHTFSNSSEPNVSATSVDNSTSLPAPRRAATPEGESKNSSALATKTESLKNETSMIKNSTAETGLAVAEAKPSENVKQVSISLSDFLKGLTQG